MQVEKNYVRVLGAVVVDILKERERQSFTL